MSITFLIVGGDSQIGRNLDEYLDFKKIKTTRRRGTSRDCLYLPLDIQIAERAKDIPDVEVAVICAGITNIEECEKYPHKTFEINVEGTITLLEVLNKKKIFTIFISSSAVFDGKDAGMEEYSEVSPACRYGYQKYLVEQHIRNSSYLQEGVAILRLTKVVTKNNGFFSECLAKLKLGNEINVFSDIRISAISMPYVLNAIRRISLKRIPGIFHLSSCDELSYYELFKEIAIKLNIDASLVIPQFSHQSDKLVIFRQMHPSIAMPHTTNVYGIAPEPLKNLVQYLSEN